MKPTFEIILPCYNPPKKWSKNVIEGYNEITQLLPKVNIILTIVNDGSSNGNLEREKKIINKNIPSIKWITISTNKGKGYAIKEGFKSSSSKFTAFIDIDFPYIEKNIQEMYLKLLDGADIVIGARDNSYYDNISLTRRMISKILKKAIKTLFKIPTTDTQAGLKAFSEKGKEIVLKTDTNRYLFDLELIKRAHSKKIKFAYVNIELKKGIMLSSMPFNILWKEFKNFIRILLIDLK